MKYFGCDLSHWNWINSFETVADSVDFVILKAGGSDKGFYTDSTFKNRYNAFSSLGVPVGVYYFVGQNFTSEEDGVADGTYDIVFKQDALLPIFNRKMLKAGHVNPEMDNPKNVIKVSAYDEDVLGSKLLTYVQVEGFENYSSFVMENNFSVYKMPKFSLYVPREGFILKSKQ